MKWASGVIAGVLVVLVGVAPATAAPACTPGQAGCLPSPTQCATGRYNGFYRGSGPTAFAVCLGGGGSVVHYVGGDPSVPCGAVIEADQVVLGNWSDPNVCLTEPAAPGAGVAGSRFTSPTTSRHGAIATESTVAGEVGRAVLEAGGNAVDAAVAAVFAYGVARPENCGIGGFGVLLFRGRDGEVAVLDFNSTAPAAATPTVLEGPGIDDFATGHRVVGVPGLVAGLAAALERLGTMPLAEAIAPAERLARAGVLVNEHLANSYLEPPLSDVVPPLGVLPLDPAPATLGTARLRLFPESARIYLRGGISAPPPGAILDLEQYADSLALIARDGPDAFYRGDIARAIDAEMRRSRSSPYPGDAGLLTYDDLAEYRPVWRQPLVSQYRGTTILGAPPPVSSIVTIEMLNILETFDLVAAGHSSADHLHLLAEAQKLAFADRDAYVADPAYAYVPSEILASDEFAGTRRSLIEPDRAGAYGPGIIDDHEAASRSAGRTGHTTHVSAVDADGNAVAVLCTLGPQFGSAVVARGTGFLLNSTLHLFAEPGHIDQIEGGKRPVGGAAPIIAVRDGLPLLIAGGAGGDFIPAAVAHMVLNALTFGMDVARAVDAARSDSPVCCELAIEAPRVPADTLASLERGGHVLVDVGEYGSGALIQAAGTEENGSLQTGSSDPRAEDGTTPG